MRNELYHVRIHHQPSALFVFGWPNVVIRLVSRILLIPVVAGLSYELLRWAGRSDTALVKILSVPGLLMQRLTTRVPDESMLEVAIAAVNVCLSEEPPQSRTFDVDGKGNEIDRERWLKERAVAEGNISPEGGQSFEGRPDRSESAADLTEEESAGISAEAMQETIAFAELLKELERPDPVRPEAQEMQETAAGPAEEPETAPESGMDQALNRSEAASEAADTEEKAPERESAGNGKMTE